MLRLVGSSYILKYKVSSYQRNWYKRFRFNFQWNYFARFSFGKQITKTISAKKIFIVFKRPTFRFECMVFIISLIHGLSRKLKRSDMLEYLLIGTAVFMMTDLKYSPQAYLSACVKSAKLDWHFYDFFKAVWRVFFASIEELSKLLNINSSRWPRSPKIKIEALVALH